MRYGVNDVHAYLFKGFCHFFVSSLPVCHTEWLEIGKITTSLEYREVTFS